MNAQLKRLAGLTAALGVMATGAAFAQASTSNAVTVTKETYVVPSSRLVVKGTRSTTQTIPQYVDGTPEIIRGLPFDLATLEGTVTVAMHPAKLDTPEPPPVPFNLDMGYLGAPLIQSRGE
jgi:hypothetical protein